MNGKKVGVVTGARRGIGRAVALALAESGFDLVLNDLVHDEDVERTLALVSGQGAQVCFLTGDIAEFASHAALVEATYHQFGRADCLVNNAGAISCEEMEGRYLEKVSLRRMVTRQDVANTVLFLLSPVGRNISGQSIGVCGNVEAL